ncbi:MAG TPA: TonB family protein [Candidatus Acidoferrum sp.]|jgi:TonB family protein|nr:TonB family protein [Candidatus Acidoferrum sp.]
MVLTNISRLVVLALLTTAPFQAIETAALRSKDVPQSSGSAPVAKAACGLQLLTDDEGVYFDRYLQDVYVSVKKSWFANMPPSVEKGEKGVSQVEFHVLQDGTVPKDSLKMTSSSKKSDLDAASLQAIREAAPFSHLPEKFSQPFIALRFTFSYNLPIGIPQKR